MTKSRSASRATANDLRAIDRLFRDAGLVRSLRADKARGQRLKRKEAFAPEELAPPFREPVRAANGVPLLKVPGWDTLPWLWQGFSTRQGGVSRVYAPEGAAGELNLGFTPADERVLVEQNRRLLAEAVTGNASTPLATVRQFHSKIVSVARPQGSGMAAKADGMITAEPGILLAIQTADCIPVLVADRKRRVVAAFHAGWRGTVERIVESGVGRMRLEFGSKPKDLIAAIGPGIGACCYAVGEEVQSAFESQFTYADELFHEVYDSDAIRIKYPLLFLTQRAPGHSPTGPSVHLDLIEANRRQLMDAGVKRGAIQFVGGCTSCHSEVFFSHRASHGYAGRLMSVIGIRPEN